MTGELEGVRQLSEWIAAGGDVGIYIVAYVLFKLHDRLRSLELEVKHYLEVKNHD